MLAGGAVINQPPWWASAQQCVRDDHEHDREHEDAYEDEGQRSESERVEQNRPEQGTAADAGVECGGVEGARRVADARGSRVQHPRLEQGRNDADSQPPEEECGQRHRQHPREESEQQHGEEKHHQRHHQPEARPGAEHQCHEHQRQAPGDAEGEEGGTHRRFVETDSTHEKRCDVGIEAVLADHGGGCDHADEDHCRRGVVSTRSVGLPHPVPQNRDAAGHRADHGSAREMVHAGQESVDEPRPDHEQHTEHEEARPPADGMAESSAEGHSEHEGERPAAEADGDRATDLIARHEVRGIGADDRPE